MIKNEIKSKRRDEIDNTTEMFGPGDVQLVRCLEKLVLGLSVLVVVLIIAVFLLLIKLSWKIEFSFHSFHKP